MADPDECIIEVIASEPTASEVPSINFNVIENSISKVGCIYVAIFEMHMKFLRQSF